MTGKRSGCYWCKAKFDQQMREVVTKQPVNAGGYGAVFDRVAKSRELQVVRATKSKVTPVLAMLMLAELLLKLLVICGICL